MFLTRSEYDRGVNTFSPEGRLFQVEYAIEAIKLGTTAIGICTKEGVLLAVEKRISSPLLITESIQKIVEIDSHVVVAMSGMAADANMLIDHARVESLHHWFNYNEKMKIASITQSICDLALQFSEEKAQMSRPFGVALLIAGVDDLGCQLYHSHPSGVGTKYKAKAIGAGSEGAQTALEEAYHENMTFLEAETKSLEILRSVMEEKLNEKNIEMSCVKTDTKTFHTYTQEELSVVIARLPPSQLDN